VLRAVEGHVLDDVGETTLVVVLEHRAGVDGEAQLGAPLWLGVVPDVIAEPVRQRADGDPRIDRHRRRQRRGLGRRRHRRQRGLRAGRRSRGGSGRRGGGRGLGRKNRGDGRRKRGCQPQKPNRS
jgi:hypothetical protein